MAAINLYLIDSAVNSWQRLSETPAGSAATIVGGWIVGTGATLHSAFEQGQERAASTFVDTTPPAAGGPGATLHESFRSENPYSGNFASANWVLHFVIRAVSSATGQLGRVRFRLYKADLDGSIATEITSGQQQAAIITPAASTTVDSDSTLTFNPGVFSVVNQYLFIQIAWERTTGASMTTADINFRTGSSSTVGTRIVTADFTYAKAGTDGADAVDTSTTIGTFPRSATEGGKGVDTGTAGRTMAKAGTDGAKASDSGTASISRVGVGTDGAKASDGGSAPAGGFDAQRQAIIDGFVSAQAEANGWNVEKANIPVTAVVRTSDTVVTITLPALPTYDITATETITATVPGAALAGGNPLVATPDFTVEAAAGVFARSGTDGAKASDSATAQSTRPVTATDGAKATDSSTPPRTRPASATDGSKATDAATVVSTRPASATDGAKAVDEASATRVRAASATDGAKAVDTATGTFPPLLRSGTDGAKATDASTVLSTRPAAGTDGAKATDSSSPLRTRPATATDGTKATDAATVLKLVVKSGTDGAKATDNSTVVRTRAVTATDGAKASDQASPIGTFARSATDGATVSDSSTVTTTPFFIPVSFVRIVNLALHVPDMLNMALLVPTITDLTLTGPPTFELSVPDFGDTSIEVPDFDSLEVLV